MPSKYVKRCARRVHPFCHEYAKGHAGAPFGVEAAVTLTDILADLRHLAALFGVDFDEVVAMSELHFRAEVRGDDDWKGNDMTPEEVPRG